MTPIKLTAAQLRKFITALISTLIGAAAEAFDLGLVHGSVAHYVAIGIGFLTTVATSYGVYRVPNEPIVPIPLTAGAPAGSATGTTTAGGTATSSTPIPPTTAAGQPPATAGGGS